MLVCARTALIVGRKEGEKNKPPDLFRFLEFIPRCSALFLPLFLFFVSFHSFCSEERRTSVRIMEKKKKGYAAVFYRHCESLFSIQLAALPLYGALVLYIHAFVRVTELS